MSTLPSNEQIDEAFYLGKSEYVWLMYVGIVGIKSDSFIKFQSTPTIGFYESHFYVQFSKCNSLSKLLLLFQWHLEAKRFV